MRILTKEEAIDTLLSREHLFPERDLLEIVQPGVQDVLDEILVELVAADLIVCAIADDGQFAMKIPPPLATAIVDEARERLAKRGE